MPFTGTIVQHINDSLKEGSLNKKKFQPGKYYGIASIIPLTGDNQGALIPGVINTDGEVEEVTPDDLYNIQIYHRVIGNAYAVTDKGAFGDGKNITSLTEMQAFVFAQSVKIGMTAEQLE